MQSPLRHAAIATAVLAAVVLTGCSGTPGGEGAGGHLSTARPGSTATATATAKRTPGATPTPSAASQPGATAQAAPPDPGTGGASGGQSKADACAIMNGVVSQASDLNDSGSDGLGDDPAAAAAAIDALSQQFAAAAGQVSNADVKPAADAVAQSAGSYFGSVKAYATDPASIDPTALSNQVVDFGNQMSTLQTLCGG